MFSHATRALNFYDKLSDLVMDQSKWSQATFGSDSERGPLGALKHLEREAVEAQEALDVSSEETLVELADCFLLLIDATRRAGFKVGDLVDAAIAKQKVNESRDWPTPISDEPVEHKRGRGP